MRIRIIGGTFGLRRVSAIRDGEGKTSPFVTVVRVEAGQECEVPEETAARLISSGMAEAADPGPGEGDEIPAPSDSVPEDNEPKEPEEPAPKEPEKPEREIPLEKQRVSVLRKMSEEAGAWGCGNWTKDECIGFLKEAAAKPVRETDPGEDIIV